MATQAPYTINYTDGRNFIVLPNTTNTAETDIGFFGHGTEIYGEVLNENLLHILENFTNATPPANPVDGQLWFDRGKSILNVMRDGTWYPVGISFNSSAPVTTQLGSLWFDPSISKIKMWNGTIWESLALASDSISMASLTAETNARIAGDLGLTGRVNAITGMKNKIMNGDMQISQRGTTFVAPSSPIYYKEYSLDRWLNFKNSSAAVTITKSSNVPSALVSGEAFQNSLRTTVNTADVSIAAGDYLGFSASLEGNVLASIFGKRITLSFWVSSSVTGIYCIELRNRTYANSYTTEYSILAANTWEKKTITLDMTTTGTWDLDNDKGLEVLFFLANGSGTYAPLTNTWQSGNYHSTPNQVNFLNTVGNSFYMTGFQLELGSVATSFDFRHPSIEEMMCKRYFEKSYDLDIAPGTSGVNGYFTCQRGASTGTGNFGDAHIDVPYKVEKRASPSLAIYSRIGGTVGKVSTFLSGVAPEVESSAFSLGSSSRTKFELWNGGALPTPGLFMSFHWTSSSELD